MTPLEGPLQDLARQRLHAFRAQVDTEADALSPALREAARRPLLDPDGPPTRAHRVWACSDFAANACIRDPMLLSELMASGDLARVYPPGWYRDRIGPVLEAIFSEEALFPALRQIRRREMVRIAWRDLAGEAELDETVRDLSTLADALIDLTLGWLHLRFCHRFGAPHSEAGEPQRLVVLGMGKLGGEELNFSSDVDLIFTYPAGGWTRAATAGGRSGLSNQEFFIRLGQRLIQLLGQATEDGLVFRVDMRLRPFGAGGALVESFNALEDYYQIHGRDWERYALIRARPVAGDVAAGEDLLERLRPFIYRRYPDFGAIDSLREMKALIAREVRAKGYRENVKLGPGGIREIEFLAQALQMIHGGRFPDLRARPTLVVLTRLGGRGHLEEQVVKELSAAYRFLRAVEHRLQEVDDQQTHRIPEDDTARERLAAAMGFERWSHLSLALEQHRNNVQRNFDAVFERSSKSVSLTPSREGTDARSAREPPDDLSGLMMMDEIRGAEILERLGFADGPGVWAALLTLLNDTVLRFSTERGRRRLDKLLPFLLWMIADRGGSRTTLDRVFQVLEAIGRRGAYFSLLLENPAALEHLVRLCAASPWVTRKIAQFPLLLDELLFPDTLYAPPNVPELKADLRNRLARVTPGDTEEEMDVLRQFKEANVLRIAAADVCRAMPLMVVSDYLTDIAEVCLDAVLRFAWRDTARRHGASQDQRGEDGQTGDSDTQEMGFLIVAYGKLGGIELGYGSDLDLVFLHDDVPGDGGGGMENSVFFTRLARRIIHFLSAHTSAGILYEVDARLRPSGRSGFLVSGMDAFAGYQDQEAWTWEHQALVRARPVAGDKVLARRFGDIRAGILKKQRDTEVLRLAVCGMREKMRRELDRTRRGVFDLKQGPGGITDIEFLVQYAVLRWADRLGESLVYTDNIRLLEGLAKADLMTKEDTDALAEAYRRYRAGVHGLALEERAPLVGEEDGAVGEDGTSEDKRIGEAAIFAEERAAVSRIWRKWMGECRPDNDTDRSREDYPN